MDNNVHVNCLQHVKLYCKMAKFVLMLLKTLTSSVCRKHNVGDGNLCQNSGYMYLIILI